MKPTIPRLSLAAALGLALLTGAFAPRVTAQAPSEGSRAKKSVKVPLYMNLTGDRVVLRSCAPGRWGVLERGCARPGDHHTEGRDRRGRGGLLVLRGRR
jgi:hypothetical protein